VRELSTTAAVGACGSAKLAGGDSDGGDGGGGYVDVGGGAASAGELLVVLAKLEGACEFSGPRGRLAAIRDTDQSNSMIRYDKLNYSYYPLRITTTITIITIK
jgi:hypothetical protein